MSVKHRSDNKTAMLFLKDTETSTPDGVAAKGRLKH